MSSLRVRKMGMALVVSAVGLALLGAGCRNPFRKKPDDVLARAYERAVAATSLRFDVVVGADTREPNNTSKQPQRVDIQLAGMETERDGGDARSEMTLTIATRDEKGTARATLGMRAVNGMTYLKLDDVAITQKDASMQAIVDGVIGAAKGVIGGKWLRVDPKETTALIKAFSPNTSIGIPDAEQARTIQRDIRAVFARHRVLVVREDIGDEAVNGVAAYHYRVGLRPDEVRAFILEFLPLFGVSTENVDRDIQQPEADAAIQKAIGEAWITKKTNDFLRFRYPFTHTFETTPGKRMTASGQAEATMRDWGKPVAIEAPADAKTIGEALGGLFPKPKQGQSDADTGDDLPDNVGGPIDTPQVDFKIGTGPDADGDGLSDDMEERYGSDPRYRDTDGDGFSDGEEVRNGYNPNGPGRLP